MKQFIHILILATLIVSCGSGSGKSNPGQLYLRFVENHEFNPNADHGRIEKFKVTITGDDLESSIVQTFPYGTDRVEFDNFAGGSTVQVLIEAINPNSYVIRRGRSEDIFIKGGQANEAIVSINNVPVYANVKDGSLVNANRFVPKIFAPGGLEFEMLDAFNGSENVLTDQVTNESVFSVSADTDSSVRTIYTPFFSEGSHQLMVQDTDTGEATTISLTVYQPDRRPVLHTTAGGFVGSQKVSQGPDLTNIIHFYQFESESF